MILQPPKTYVLNAFLDVPSLDAVFARGRTFSTIRADLRTALAPYGVRDVTVEGTRYPLVNDTLNLRMVVSPPTPIDTGITALGDAILRAANAGNTAIDGLTNARSVFLPHTDRGSVLGAISTIFTAGTTSADVKIVDDRSVTEGADLSAPPPASSSLASAIGGVIGARTASDDAARNNSNVHRQAEGLPWYLVLAIAGGATLVVGVSVAYIIRSVR